MKWRVERIVNLSSQQQWEHGCSYDGFFDRHNQRYIVDYFHHWVGCIGADGQRMWSCGPEPVAKSPCHIFADFSGPGFVCDQEDGGILVSCFGNHRIYRINPMRTSAEVLIDGDAHGLADTGFAVVNQNGHIWVNEVTGCRIWEFDANGRPLRSLGDGKSGFQSGEVPIEQARFHWIYDIRSGNDGNIYVLDSRNFAVRMIDVRRSIVTCLAGTGRPGYSGDGGNALAATFGSRPQEKFDGPWAMSLDDDGNIYVGDTQNHVVRMIERPTGRISTIAGRYDCKPDERNDPTVQDPMQLNLPRICAMAYHNRRLYVSAGEQGADQVVLCNE